MKNRVPPLSNVGGRSAGDVLGGGLGARLAAWALCAVLLCVPPDAAGPTWPRRDHDVGVPAASRRRRRQRTPLAARRLPALGQYAQPRVVGS
jgi:hypothetical protein